MMHSHTAFRPRRTAILLAILMAMLGLVLGCSGGASSSMGGGGGAAPTPDTIMIKNFAYEPATLTVAPGATITVINQDSAPHTVTAGDKSFDSGTITGGQRGTITAPAKPGSYSYICTIHQYMTGTLMVK